MTSPGHWSERANNVRDMASGSPAADGKKDDPAPEKKEKEQKKRYVFVATKGLKKKDQVRLAQNFQQVVVYNPLLMGKDVTKIPFDCLVLDASRKEDHEFMELNRQQLLQLESFVLKKRWTNWKDLAEAIGAMPLRKIPKLVGEAFMLALGRESLPKLSSRFWGVVQACFQSQGQ